MHQYTNTIYIYAGVSVNNVIWLKREYEHFSVGEALSGPVQMTKEPQEVEPWIRKQPPFLWLNAELMSPGAVGGYHVPGGARLLANIQKLRKNLWLSLLLPKPDYDHTVVIALHLLFNVITVYMFYIVQF